MQENRRRYIKAIGLISIYHCLPANAGLFSLIGKTKAISKSADDIDTKPVDTLPNNNISIRESIDSDSENNKSSNDQETLSGSNTVDFQTKTIESLDEASFPKARKKLFTDISRLFDNSKIMFAKTSAKEFGKDFIAGAKEGNLRLDKLRLCSN